MEPIRKEVYFTGSSEGYNSSMMMKFLCSFGGRILPRPWDGKLRYVGGQTRIRQIRKDISWQELMHKALQIYNQTHAIKYQLPHEDFDAFISVSSNNDLQNMMEEYNRLAKREGSQKLRIFLFSKSDLEDAELGLSDNDSEVQYLFAINGIDLGSRKNSTMIGVNFSANNTNETNPVLDKPVIGETPIPITIPHHMLVNQQVENSGIVETLGNKMVDGSIPQLSNNYMEINFDEVSKEHSLPPTKMDKSNAIDLKTLHPPPLPTRVYYSERVPREQVELLNRSSKSDDAYGSRSQVSDLLSESGFGDNLHEDNIARLETEIFHEENNNKPLIEERRDGELNLMISRQISSGKHHHDSASNFPEVDLEANEDFNVQGVLGSSNFVSKQVQESHLDFIEEKIRDLHERVGTETTVVKSDHDSPMNDSESMQFDAKVENLRPQEPEHEVGKIEKINSNPSPPYPSSGDFDTNTLQVIMNEDLEELKVLGSGSFGTVYHGKWGGTDVAIKRLKKTFLHGRSSGKENLTEDFWREAEILSKLRHPNVMAFYGVVKDGPEGTMAIVTEYMVDGSLSHAVHEKEWFIDYQKKLMIARDAANGMKYLHSKNIVHFDLKCENLLVNLKDPSRPICKVGDFGLSKVKIHALVSGAMRGSLPWMAPEMMKVQEQQNDSSNKVSEKVDVFSFGILLWEILTGEIPYASSGDISIIGKIMSNTIRPTIPDDCDPKWRTLMEECWETNPVARPSFTEIATRLHEMLKAASQNQSTGQQGI
ncbi:hypothetical protein VNO77_27786 [Canavalia gladiata]|uniref:Protein kinase domain-containing protein n=1 Tax=Canavalia gladiata TaxID=3824 RepID=A0AAN9KVW6_CANGL